jgi:hypothetical protein
MFDSSDRILARVRMKGMKRLGVLLVGVALALTACDRSSESGPTTETGGATTETRRLAVHPDARTVAVYSAVVGQLVTKDHTFGGGEAPFERIFIDVRIDEDAADPLGGLGDHPPSAPRLPAEDQAAILRELTDLPRVRFVEDADSVIVGRDSCARVKGKGALITLGPIARGSKRVTVPNGLFIACLGGQWLTYVLERRDGDWRVTGTNGPIAIS